jgi:hypothetical protein
MDIVAPLIVMSIIVVGVTATGKQEQLCKAMGGTYTPAYTGNVCPGGSWLNLFRSVPTPAPTQEPAKK